MKLLLYQIKVIGKVQGVWFRKHTCDKANRLEIKGFVRNEKDGSLYIEAEGYCEQLEEFIKWFYVGSPLSKVNGVKYVLGEFKNYGSFEIRS